MFADGSGLLTGVSPLPPGQLSVVALRNRPEPIARQPVDRKQLELKRMKLLQTGK